MHLHKNKISICTDSENGPLAFSCASENPDCWAEKPEKKDLQQTVYTKEFFGKLWSLSSPTQSEELKLKKK